MSELLGYELPEIPEVVTQEWISGASEIDIHIARSQGKVTGSGIYARPVEPKPERYYEGGKPPQLAREQLKSMSPEQITQAITDGRLDDVLGR